MHGYRVGQHSIQLAEDLLRLEEGSLYPALYRLEERGYDVK
jgi:PadR family transcriptional regulator PadR